MIYCELDLVSIFRDARRDCHDASVADEYIEFIVGFFEKGVGGCGDGGERGLLARDKG